MANPPSLTVLFGANAAQSATNVDFTKADWSKTGFTPAAANTAEAILAALIQMAIAGQDTSTDTNMQISVSDQFLLNRGGTLYRRYRYVCDFFVSEPVVSLNPNNIQ